MDDLAFLHQHIESYADYTNDVGRRLADEQIRAYVGEALARIPERLPAAGAAEALAPLMFRCQFADQVVVHALDADDAGESEITAIHAADRELVTLADLAPSIGAADLTPYIAKIDAALNRRARVIIGGARAATPSSDVR